MKFNSETWYSKAIAIFLFLSFPILAFYLGAKFQKSTVLKNTGQVSSSPVAAKGKVTFQKSFDENLLKYRGTIEVPTPCHEIKQEVKVMESFPEQVRIDLTIINPPADEICAQVIAQKEFSGEAAVSENAQISVYLNGQKVY